MEELKTEPRAYWNDAAIYVAEKSEAQGSPEDAVQWYRKCLALSHGNEWPGFLARRRLAELEAKLKDSPAPVEP